MARQFSKVPPFTRPGSQSATSVPDPFALAARRFERSGAELYLHDPVGFARDCILWPTDEGLTGYQTEILSSLAVRRRAAVRGPHGLGKTTTNALAILWFAITREAARLDWKCVTTAGSWHQLEHYLWPEVHKWAARVDWAKLETDPWRPDRELLSLNIKLHHGSAFAAASTRVELIEGAHADHLLFVFDESKAIRPDTFDAAEGALNGTGEAYALAQSTPGEPQGRFFDIHQQKPGYEDWWVRWVRKHEVIEAGRMSGSWAEQRRKQWGADNYVYQNRVEGAFWISDEDAVIPLSWVEAANERWIEWDRAGRPSTPGLQVSGVDVARGGADRTAVARRQGSVVTDLVLWNLRDTTKIASKLVRRMRHQTDLAVIDVIGVGAGVVDLMRRWNRNVNAFNASRATKRRDRSGLFGFKNQRSAMWWMLREALDPAFDPTLALPPDEDLLGELTAPKWTEVGGKILVESKDGIKKRLGRSTDRADAVGHTMLVDAEFDSDEIESALVVPYTSRATDTTVPWAQSSLDVYNSGWGD
jgi:hypothetical protein